MASSRRTRCPCQKKRGGGSVPMCCFSREILIHHHVQTCHLYSRVSQSTEVFHTISMYWRFQQHRNLPRRRSHCYHISSSFPVRNQNNHHQLLVRIHDYHWWSLEYHWWTYITWLLGMSLACDQTLIIINCGAPPIFLKANNFC
jgi:hypothetical protein